MRVLFAVIYNVAAALLAVLMLPFRLFGRRGSFVLGVELTADPPWRAPARGFWSLGRRRRDPMRPASIEQLATRLDQAASDPRVRAVLIKIEDFDGSGAKLDAVAAMVDRLRERGKEVVFYGRAVSMREYALMTRGTRVQLAPGGHLDLRGYSADLYVLGGALGRVGIGAHFLRRGEHKTAPELFTDSAVSEPQKQAVTQVLGELFESAVERIAQGRKRSADEVRRLVDDGPYTARRALGAGLVDVIGDGEDLQRSLAAAGEETAPLMPLAAYRGTARLGRPEFRPLRRRPRVAVVRIDGVIKLGESVHLPLTPKAAGSDTIAAALRRAREDESIRAIVLFIDSRGGSSLASELLYRAIRRAAGKKPVVAFIDRVAASGGYMAAVGAGHIVAAPAAITGSIGVFTGKFEISGLLEKLGIGTAVLRLGRNAGALSGFQPWSDAERAALERDVEETYRDFLGIVAEGRRRPLEEIEPLAAGRIYTGRRALEVGLIDEVGGFEAAVDRAAKLAGLEGRPEVLAVGAPARSLHALKHLHAPELVRAVKSLAAGPVLAFAPGWRIDPEP